MQWFKQEKENKDLLTTKGYYLQEDKESSKNTDIADTGSSHYLGRIPGKAQIC